MIMVVHKTIGMTEPMEANTTSSQQVEEHSAIMVCTEDVFALIATRRDVIKSARELDA